MPSPLSPRIRSFTPPSSALNFSLTETTTTMSYDATTLSTTSSLSSSIVDDTSRPSSTRPEAGWGNPSPVPDSFPPISLATVSTPIHFVTSKSSPIISAPPHSPYPLTLFLTLALPFTPSDALISKTLIFVSCQPTSPHPLNKLSFLASFRRSTLRSKDLW